MSIFQLTLVWNKDKGRNKTKTALLLPKIKLVNMTLEHALANVTILKHVGEAKVAKYLLPSSVKLMSCAP